MHQKVVRLALLVALAFGLAPAAVLAQSASGADLEGTIRDDTGAALPGVTIVATNVDTGVQRTTFSNADGRYRLPALPVGAYTLTVSLEGFTTVERTGLVLQIGQVATIDLVLPLAGLEETVTVTQAAPIVETGRTQVGAVVSRTEIDNLPINGRNFLDFSTTVAGVTGQQMSGQGSGISFNGQRARSNNISIDGADSNGQLNGNTRLTLSQEAVREFQVVTSQFAPEFGRAGGGLVNIVSKSGTNVLSGNGFLFVRDESFDARNAFVPAGEPKPQFERQNFGGTFGGPIVRNRTFFFGSVERVDRSESGVVSISDASVQAVNAALAARPIPGSNVRSISNGVYPISLETTLVSLKIDHSFNPNNNLAVRYIYGKTLEENAGGVGVGGLIDTSGGGGLDGEDQSLFLSWTRIFGSSMFSETRFQFAPRDLQQYANDAVGPRVTISGVATFGRNVNFPVLLNEDRYEFKQDFSIDRGRHFFKFGADVTRVNAFSSFPISFAGSFTFGSLATFLAGTPTTFTQGFGNPAMDLPNTLVGLYWQDTFKVGNSLTLVYGLRYDYDGQPQGITRDPNNPVEAPLQTGINRDKN
ncbi:MAG: carboxypeptidase regulatory-like domain-containing protein, partial [Acidobacteria bacterium]|nr:carboxypeptidase regulatory-like domain-containing protein [Acidobacteriota bacterium]